MLNLDSRRRVSSHDSLVGLSLRTATGISFCALPRATVDKEPCISILASFNGGTESELTAIEQIVARDQQDRQSYHGAHPLPRSRFISLIVRCLRLAPCDLLLFHVHSLRLSPDPRRAQSSFTRLGRPQRISRARRASNSSTCRSTRAFRCCVRPSRRSRRLLLLWSRASGGPRGWLR